MQRSLGAPRAVLPLQRPAQRLVARQRGALQVRAASTSSNDFKNGMTIEMDGAPYKVVEFLHVKPGKGSAFVRSKLKNFITGNTVEKTWRAGEPVDLASVEKKETQFTYAEGDEYVFMDMQSYEETRITKDEDWAKYLKEGMDVGVLLWNGKVISVEVPNTVELEVVETDPGVKGNTAGSGGSKPATLETGAVIQVPLFISTGERIKVDTRTDSYLQRAS
ncbi:Elongation factor P [Micractinium conductrix]|uniref:Elongation factor P n=1 Tax=Micractinium conductrix TaxID=554055 RepID=A0A2P6VH08_9CHLO|nr:Elongation factor P [Micractinium conductrix]|eukprot:PSC73370.1 Elongation factor P [Micractinium conductrix]